MPYNPTVRLRQSHNDQPVSAMKLCSLFVACFVMAGGSFAQAQSRSSDELIRVLTAPDTTRDVRKEAAAQLAQIPPGEALPKLSRVRKTYGHTISNWGGDLFRMGLEVTWEQAAAITAAYAWSDSLKNPKYTRQEKGAALFDLFLKEPSLPDRVSFLWELKFHWIDAAEPEAVAILRNPTADWRSRYVTAEVLLDAIGMKYYGEVYSVGMQAPLEHKEWFARLLFRTKSSEWEARVVRYAISVIQEQRAAHPDRPGHSYFIASSLGDYVGVRFKPDQSDPRYEGPHGLKDAFFIETVDNALKWWRENKEKY